MKKLYIIPQLLLGATALLSACSQDELVDAPNNGNTHTIELNLTANCPTFDQARGTRAEGKAWKEGDKLRLTFIGDNTTSYGTATYSAGSNKWVLQYSGNIANTQNGKLVAYYFESPESETNTSVILNGKSPIYCDSTGIFTFDGATLNATASLSPANSRMRLQGHPGDTLYVSGAAMTYSYNADHSFTDSYGEYYPMIISKKADSDGKFYSDYLYFTSTEKYKYYNNNLLVMTNQKAYLHTLTDANLQKGTSGYLTVPGTEGASNWVERNPFANLQFPDSISDDRRAVIMKYLDEMVKVDGGNLTLGPSDDQVTVHMYPFYIMRTQVSNELFEAVMGYEAPTPLLSTSVTSKGLYTLAADDKQLPNSATGFEVGISSNTLVNFFNKFRLITHLTLDIPYESEWEYAARGGQKSQNYSWIADCSSEISSWNTSMKPSYTFLSGYHAQIHVDEGYANELGLFGLCCNASEACRYFGSTYSGALSMFSFTPNELDEENVVKISWRGASDYESYMSMFSYNRPYRNGHSNTNNNKARGLRLVLRYHN